MKNVFDAEGNLRDVDPLAGLVSCWRERTSGALRFARGAAECGFDLAEGDVVAIVSSDPRFETAAILVRAGKLAGDAVERLGGEGGDAALLALQSGLLTRREWKWGEKIRAIEVFSDLLSWEDGRYRLETAAAPAAGEFRLPVPRLVLELFLRSRDRHLIEHQLGAPDQALVRGERFEEEFGSFGLTADAESVVRLIDGRSTAAQISGKAPADEFAVRKLLAALVTLGLVHPVPVAPGRPADRVRVPEPAPVEPEPEPEPAREAEPAWPDEPAPPPAEEPFSPFPAASFEESQRETEEAAFETDLPAEEPSEIEAPPIELPGTEVSPLDDLPPSGPPRDWSMEREESPRSGGGPFETPADLPIPEAPAETPEEPAGGSSRALVWAFVGLAVAIAAVVLWRMADRGSAAAAARPRPTAVPAVTFPPPATAVAGVAPRETPAPAPAGAPATPVPRLAAGSKAATPAARAAGPASAPGGRAAAASKRTDAAAGSADAWVQRAERDRRRVAGERRSRFSIQLELVCEVSSLTDAWRHDRGGAMWLLAARHGDRDCYRVFWGRYPSLEAAKRAKSGIPGYFVTARNRPAVVAVK